MRVLLSTLLFFGLSTATYAQNNLGCGTTTPVGYQPTTPAAERQIGYAPSARGGVRYVPVVYHIVQKTDGTGGVSLKTVFETHCALNEGYDTAQIYFYIRKIDTIKNNALWAMDDGSGNVDYGTGYSAFQTRNLANTTNVYITGGLPGLCGFATFPPGLNGGGLFLNKSCCGRTDKTIPHEMGHYFNLPHTFDQGNEYVDGSNCSTAGDYFCDTPADPSDQRAACPYNGTLRDAHNDLYNTVVDESLFMSYFNDACINRFSPQEIGEMNAVLSNDRSYLLNQTMPPVAPFDTVQIIYPTAGSLSVNGTPVTFIWNKTPNAKYYNLYVQSSTSSLVALDTLITDTTFSMSTLTANKTYKYKVRPISYGRTCGETANFQIIKISTLKATITSSNPTTCNTNDGTITATPTTGTAPYTFLWSNGATTSSVNGLAPGFYYVTITDAALKQSVAAVRLNGPVAINVNITKSGNTLTAATVGGSGPYSYLWSDGNTTAANTNLSFGSYTVTVTDNNGCTASQAFVYSSLGVELETKLSMKVFPNPANNVSAINVQIDLNEKTEAVISILNVTGEIIAQQKKEFVVGENNTAMDVASLASGIYFVQFKSNKLMKTERVSIMK